MRWCDMGIYIGLAVSARVAQEQWNPVYTEALDLARKLGLADRVKKAIHGQEVYCLVLTKESEQYGMRGWTCAADYGSGDGAEAFFFPRELSERPAGNHVDLLAQHADDFGVINLPDPGVHCRELWGAKTQGYYYHYGLLAVGCLVQDRLGDDALVYGDITAGQCREAVKDANKFLTHPIRIPCQCDPERWMERIGRLSVEGTDRVRMAVEMYIGRKDAAFGERLRSLFPHEVLVQYWRKEFNGRGIDTYGFEDALKLYLTMGFDVAELCGLVPLADAEAKEKFVRMIMDTKMHWEEKDCSDIMVQDPDDPSLYGIEATMIRLFARGSRNRKVDRYIPIDELRGILRNGLGPGFDADAVVDACLLREKELENAQTPEERRERDPSAEVNRVMNEQVKVLEQKTEQYKIYKESLLRYYRPGDRIDPVVEKSTRNVLEFARSLMEKDTYRERAEQPAGEKKSWLAALSGHLCSLRDQDWERIFSSIEREPSCFARYYPLARISPDNSRIRNIVTALLINDDLYEYICTLMEQPA